MVGVTGVGSLPGTDLPAALRMVLDTLGSADHGLPHLPELPGRGPHATMIARACAVLVDLPVSLDAGVWRLSSTPGIDLRRARAALRDDLDMLQEAAADWQGRFKVQLAGPWTLSSAVFRPLGGRVLADRSARRDLAQSLAQGAVELLGSLRQRLPSASIVLQVDEPGLPAVLAGQVPTEGGFFRHRRIDRPEASDLLTLLTGLTEESVLHCCAAGVDVDLVTRSGFPALSIDQALVTDWDQLAGFVDGGRSLHLGCLPTESERTWSTDQLLDRVLGVLRPLELGPVLADRLVLSPACGLAGFSARGALSALAVLVAVATRVDETLRDL